MARAVISCFCQNLLFRLYLAIKSPIFKLRPLLRFLYLINSFYRRYVPSMYNRSNRSNRLTRLYRLNFVRLARWSATLIGHGHSIDFKGGIFPAYTIRRINRIHRISFSFTALIVSRINKVFFVYSNLTGFCIKNA